MRLISNSGISEIAENQKTIRKYSTRHSKKIRDASDQEETEDARARRHKGEDRLHLHVRSSAIKNRDC